MRGDTFWILWVTAIAFALISLATVALDHVPKAAFDPTSRIDGRA